MGNLFTSKLFIMLVVWDEEFMACWCDHGDEGDELFKVNLQVSIQVKVRKEHIQSFILLDFLFSRKIEWK